MPRENIWSLGDDSSYITINHDSDLNKPDCLTIETSNHNNQQLILQLDKKQVIELLHSVCRFYRILPNFQQVDANGNIVITGDTSRLDV